MTWCNDSILIEPINPCIWIAWSKLTSCPIELGLKFGWTIIFLGGRKGGSGVLSFPLQKHQLISANPVLTILLISYIQFETQLLRSGNCQTAGFPEQSLIAVPYKQKIMLQNKYLMISEIESEHQTLKRFTTTYYSHSDSDNLETGLLNFTATCGNEMPNWWKWTITWRNKESCHAVVCVASTESTFSETIDLTVYPLTLGHALKNVSFK